jgi:hypothetical protein
MLLLCAEVMELTSPQSLLESGARNRAIVAAAVRYTFIDTSSSYDELIAPLIVEFLSLMRDENLVSWIVYKNLVNTADRYPGGSPTLTRLAKRCDSE